MSASRIKCVRLLAVGCVVLVSACLKSTEPQPSLINLNGTWHYTGDQTVPVRETLEGTLEITRESGVSFQGQLQLVGVNTQTQAPRSLTGPVSGSEVGTNVIDFDADLETTRRHVGQIVADTITGTWVSSDGTMASGTFRLERETQ
jgi:hypothetical protein